MEILKRSKIKLKFKYIFIIIPLILIAQGCVEYSGELPGGEKDGAMQSHEAGKNLEYERQAEIRQAAWQKEQVDSGEVIDREFNWDYKGYKWKIEMKFSDNTYNFYKNRSRHRDYDLFVSDPYDDDLISHIVENLKAAGLDAGLGDEEIVYLVVSFVQSLPYTSDNVTTGFDEYPRFPYETLYDNGGDCEDTSILVSALLYEMGYGVVLIQLPGHIAVGVRCSEKFTENYYMYEGSRYCYLETTGENWQIGKIPDEYKGQDMKAKIIPVKKRPFLYIDFLAGYRYNTRDVYVDVNVSLTNLGSGDAENTILYVALQKQNTSWVWDDIESNYLQILPEQGYNYYVKNLHAPYGETFRIYVIARGDNVISEQAVSEWIIWE